MHDYQAPLTDMQFVLRELADQGLIAELPGFEDASLELYEAVLEEASKFAGGVLSPLNKIGDTEGVRWQDTQVLTAAGWKEAYGEFVAAGWNALSCSREFGGQNLPRVLSALVEEMWNGANMAFTLCPMLTRGAIESIDLKGSPRQKETYLPKMVSGEWTGTMNLTEPQAGSDLAAVKTRATPQGNGLYKLEGQKIFITYGEHDLTQNIVHMVLARTPNAPEGVKGISLFLVPKFMVNPDGSLGERNDVRCLSVEHKLGIHASPTCVLAFGQNGGARGELIGEENRGLEYMFIMMNAARFAVGLEGIGLSERALQSALGFAAERVQGTEPGQRGRVPIIRHPDVRRMLMLMKSQTEAMRALAGVVAVSLDAARLHPDSETRAHHQAFADLMIPVVKGWCTENSIEIASLGIQIHGGMGFIEETGVAQQLRDARITTIYEGTTGIQANDLLGRKLVRDGGHAARVFIAELRVLGSELARSPRLSSAASVYDAAIEALQRSVEYAVSNFGKDSPGVSGGRGAAAQAFWHRGGRLDVGAVGSHRREAFRVARTRRPARVLLSREGRMRAFLRALRDAAGDGTRALDSTWRRGRPRRGGAAGALMDYRYPSRIVCLTEEPTEVLYALGEQDRIVGISGFTVRPARARREKPKVSAFTSAKVDRILELKPDFVIGFSDIQAEIAQALIKAGIEVWISNHRSVAGILSYVRRLGALVGAAERAEHYAQELELQIEAVRSKAAVLSCRPRIYFEEWDEPLISCIRWVSELIGIAGGDDVFPERAACALGKDRILADGIEVVRRSPDIILGSWCGKRFRPNRVIARPGWEDVPAVRTGELHEIKSPLILQPGPAALTDGLAAIHAVIAQWAQRRPAASAA